MADASNRVAEDSAEVNQLKRDLEGYRELILPLNKVLEWEQNHYPAILVGIITLIFSIMWYLEPSVLTSVCLLGIIFSITDFALPTLTSYLFSSAEWTVIQERQFEAICVRLLNAKKHIINSKNNLLSLKRDKPKIYLLVLMGTFALMAWLGSLIDNLLLTYLLVIGVALVPGLRKRGIIQKLSAKVTGAFAGLKRGQEKAGKTKTN